jgi:dephospho-CoA kinase
MIVGISGKYCAGKSTVSELLEDEWGYHQIDVDRLGHRALERRRDDVLAEFGNELLTDGTIDRRRLGSIVFSSSEALSRLEAIVHPEMIAMVREEIAAVDPKRIAVNAAILFKMGLDSLCDLVLWVEAPILQRFRRARRRDSLPILQIVKRLYTQRGMKPQSSRRDVDIHTVRNSGNRKELRRRIAAVLSV